MIDPGILQELKAVWMSLEVREGRDAMIDPGILQELRAVCIDIEVCEATRRSVVDVLVERFGKPAEDLATQLKSVTEYAMLKKLVKLAAVCPDLEAFQKELAALHGDMP